MHNQMERLYKAAKSLRSISSKAELARILNESSQTLNNWEKRGISNKGMLNAQRLIGCSAAWLETGEGPANESTRVHTSSVNLYSQTYSNIKSIPVPIFDAAGSMGIGELQPENDTVTASVWLSDKWIKKHISSNISSKENLAIITGYGDSMLPTFDDGDVLLIDTGIKSISADGVYVLSANNKIYIKRVRQRFDGQYEISSDNPAIKTIDVLNGDHEISVHGRVVWAWNGRKL